MKRQLFRSKYGFTLFELMIVMTIFGIFVMATSMFDWRPQNDMERSDRMVVSISSTLRTEVQNVTIGKMPRHNGLISTKTILTIWTWGLYTSYSWTTGEIGSGAFINPYFDGDTKYIIKNVTWTWSNTVWSISWTGQIIIEPTGISFSGAGITWSGFTLVEIRVGYDNPDQNIHTRKITFDRRTGKISETKY